MKVKRKCYSVNSFRCIYRHSFTMLLNMLRTVQLDIGYDYLSSSLRANKSELEGSLLMASPDLLLN